jgi:hypothetical protein
MAIDIQCPDEGDPATVVLGTGTTGIISAFGTATSDSGDAYQRVFGMVFPGALTASAPGPVTITPPAGADFVDNSGSGATANWFLGNIPGAACASTGAGVTNTLVIWARFTSTGPATAFSFRHFQGVCGTQTSCPRPLFLPFPPRVDYCRPGIVALTTAPRVWRVEAAGKAWKGVWSLELRDGGKAGPTWGNAGDGVETYRIALSSDGPLAATWRLTFVLGDDRLCYTRSAEAWQALGANVLDLDPDETKCSFIPPATIRVTPG